jgi:hypothetical protein
MQWQAPSYGISLESGEQAAPAIQPFAGRLAGTLFGIGIFIGHINHQIPSGFLAKEMRLVYLVFVR